jgi:hypothetical protein
MTEPDWTLIMHHCRSLRGLGLSPDQYMAAITEFHKALTNQALEDTGENNAKPIEPRSYSQSGELLRYA